MLCVGFPVANKNDITLPWSWIKNKLVGISSTAENVFCVPESVQQVFCNCCLELYAPANNVLLDQSDFQMDSLSVYFSTFNVFISPSTQFLLPIAALRNNSRLSRQFDTRVTTSTPEKNALKLEQKKGEKSKAKVKS